MHFKRFLNGRLTLVIFLPSAQKFGFKPWRVSSHQTKNIVSMNIWQFSKLRWANSIYVLTVKFATGFGFGATTNWRDFRWLDCLSLWLISSLPCLELLYNSFCTEPRRLIFQGFVLKRFFFYQLLHRHILVSTKNIYSIFRHGTNLCRYFIDVTIVFRFSFSLRLNTVFQKRKILLNMS